VKLNQVVNSIITIYNDYFHEIYGGIVTESWEMKAKGILKGELKRRHLGYKELTHKLRDIGIEDNERNIANKVSRGSFTAVFFLQCLEAIGCKEVRLEDV
jgi:3-mercaptopyruvate sulfurtransferase SseA